MKRRALAVVLGYFLVLEVLLAVGRRVHLISGGTYFTTLVADVPFDTVARLLGSLSTERWAWGCVGPPVLCLAVFLGVPLALAEQRTVSRQVCVGGTLASGCLVALLVFSVGLAVGEVYGLGASHAWGAAWLAFPVLTWAAWAYGFAGQCHKRPASEVLARQCALLRWAAVGGLLVGVPAYLLTRRPPGFVSGVGGLMALFLASAALLFSAGPPLLLWLARRWSAK